jgi:hypothetical protein
MTGKFKNAASFSVTLANLNYKKGPPDRGGHQ